MTEPPHLHDADRDKLVKEHLGYVRAMATRIQREVSSQLDFEELVAYGSRGLVEASQRFDPTRGVAFITFAHYRIRGAIFDGLRESGWISRSHYARFASGADAFMENQSARSSAPGPGLADRVTDVATAVEGLAAVFLTAMDDEPVDEESPDGEVILESKQQGKAVREAVSQLPDKERRMVEMFYFEGRTLLDAGKSLGLSKSWASRLHARAIKLLSRKLVALRPEA